MLERFSAILKRPADEGLAEMESKLTTFEYEGRKGGGPSLEDVEINAVHFLIGHFLGGSQNGE